MASDTLVVPPPKRARDPSSACGLASFCGSLAPALPLLANGEKGWADAQRAVRMGHLPPIQPA